MAHDLTKKYAHRLYLNKKNYSKNFIYLLFFVFESYTF